MGLTKTLYDYQETARDRILHHWTKTLNYYDSDDENLVKIIRENSSTRLLSATTGSGKTVIVSSAILDASEIFYNENREVVFIILAPNSLNKQLHSDFISNGVFSDGRLRDVTVDELRSGRSLKAGDVLFANYASVDKEKNTIIAQNERNTDLSSQLDRLRSKGVQTILIVDEAHVNYSGKRAQMFVNDIVKPDIRLLVTATPHENIAGYEFKNGSDFTDQTIVIPKKDIVESGSIVEKVIINQNIEKVVLSDVDSDLDVDLKFIDLAIAQKKRMDAAYAAEGSNVNTLVGIQIPSKARNVFEVAEDYGERVKDSVAEKTKLNRILDHLSEKHGLSVDSNADGGELGEVSYWLAEHKTLNAADEVIKPNDSNVDVIIFKEAIAVGWDCPRLGTMALLRENKTKPFTLQTVGRSMRQPEQKQYNNEMLNYSYVFSAHELVKKLLDEHPETVQKGRVESFLNTDDETTMMIYDALKSAGGLPTSYYKLNNDARIKMSNIIKAGVETFNDFGVEPIQFGGGINVDDWANKIGLDFSSKRGTIKVLAEQELDMDASEVHLKTFSSNISVSDSDAEKEYENIIVAACLDGSFSVNRVTAKNLRKYIVKNALPRRDEDLVVLTEQEFAMIVTANEHNKAVFSDFLSKVMEKAFKYQGSSGKSRIISLKDNNWLPPSVMTLNGKKVLSSSSIPEVSTSLYKSIDTVLESSAEDRYIKHVPKTIVNYLDEHTGGHVYFRYMRNGTQGNHLGIDYTDVDNVKKLTFPDFINIFYINNKIYVYIVEVKTKNSNLGDTEDSIRAKAKALEDYAKRASHDNLHVFGKVWSFGEGELSEHLNVKMTAPESANDSITDYIETTIANMIEKDMKGFKA